MIIESLEILNYGPFAFPTALEIDPEVTVLTGPNDTGKSSVLRLLARMFHAEGLKGIDATEFNSDNLHTAQIPWSERDDFGAVARISLAGSRPPGLPELPQDASAVTIRYGLAPNKPQRMAVSLFRANSPTPSDQGAWPVERPLAQAVWLPPEAEVRDAIPLAEANPVERRLLRCAFGDKFAAPQLTGLAEVLLHRQLERGQERLNELVRNVLPPSLGLQWKLRETPDRASVSCLLQDAHGGLTPLGGRGTGVRRMMAVLAQLMTHDFAAGHTVVLFDEPETSLHADSQHLLRLLLEGLGQKPGVQVVYATHSPSMINVMRPHAIRLLSRATRDGSATTVVDNRPFKENYQPVRASLGLTPADSLLYAPVTVVVEGDTEVVGLPLLLLRLAAAKEVGFDPVERLLSQAHFLDGMGDQFGYMCRLARSQGATPVVFLDGDKRKHLAKFGLDGVPTVLLDGESEFEELVPTDVYLRAVAELVGDTAGRVTGDNFRDWSSAAGLPARMVFTKRVGRWLDALDLLEPAKARVMRRAIELVDAAQVTTGPLLKLVAEMKRLLPD